MIDRGSHAMPAAVSTVSRESPGRDVGAQFEALVMANALEPLAKALGFYGDAIVRSAATAMFRDERDALTERLDALGDRVESGVGEPATPRRDVRP